MSSVLFPPHVTLSLTLCQGERGGLAYSGHLETAVLQAVCVGDLGIYPGAGVTLSLGFLIIIDGPLEGVQSEFVLFVELTRAHQWHRFLVVLDTGIVGLVAFLLPF